MKHSLSGTVCALALFCASVPVATTAFTAPAQAQYMQVSFDAFHDDLARYGNWVYSDRWGPVWLPDVGSDFHPYYSNGYWANTIDYGWTWISDDPWGDITYHYGRWVDDPYDGWMWIPGYVWSPAWVVWRSNDDAMGWMPMPPDRDFISGSLNISGGGLRFAVNFNDADDYYGYRSWYGRDYDDDRFARMWVFVDNDRFGDRDFRRYARPANNFAFIRNTTNITNYTVVNNIIVNRSVDQRRFERAGGRRFEPVRAAQVLRNPGRITNVDEGRRVQRTMRERIPQGSGAVRSAPRLTEAVASQLSDRVPERRGRGSGRLQTRQEIQSGGFADRSPSTDGRRDRVREQRPEDQRADQQREDRPREERARADRERQDQQRLQEQRQTQEPRMRQEQDRIRADRERQDQDRVQQQRQAQERDMRQQQDQARAQEQQQRQAQEQARAQQQQQRQQQDQARAQQQQQRQQQEQARGQQEQARQQQEQARAQQQQQRQQQEQARGQPQQQRQQQEQARAQQQQQNQQQEQARGQQRQQDQQAQQAQRKQREERRAQNQNADDGSDDRGRGRNKD